MSKNKLGQHVKAVEYAIQIVSQVQGVTPLAIANLKEVRDFLNVMNDLLVVTPAAQEGGGVGVFEGVPIQQVQGYVPVAPIPGAVPAPAAVQLSSGIQQTVTGCVAAQPQGLQQTAAQQQLNGLLAEKKKQADLTASLQAQVQAAQAPVAPTAPVVGQAPAMTLEQFKAMHGTPEPATPALPMQPVSPAIPQLPIQPVLAETVQPALPTGQALEPLAPILPQLPIQPTAPAEGSPQQRLENLLEQKKAMEAAPAPQIQTAGPAQAQPQEAQIQSLSDAVEASQGPANTEE